VTRLRLFVPAIAILLAIPALGIAVQTSTADHTPQVPCLVILCPDLSVDGSRFGPRIETRTFTASSCDVSEGSTVAGTRTLLRFRYTTPNLGNADLIVGNPSLNPLWFEFGACHSHYHFKEYADYRLWEPADHAAWEALRVANPGVQAHVLLEAHPELQPIVGEKRGFCVIDIIRYTQGAAPRWLSCDMQGITVGWADEYHWSLSGQYVDITNVPGGTYVLEAEVNAEQFFMESNYDNNRAFVTVTI